MRVQSIGLKHHRDVAVFRQNFGHVALTDIDPASRRRFQSGKDPQRRGFTGTRRAQQNQKFAWLDLEVEFLQNLYAAKALLNRIKFD